jgi:20S proteasome alpha/beta subunit
MKEVYFLLILLLSILCYHASRLPFLSLSVARGSPRNQREGGSKTKAANYGLEYLQNIDMVNAALANAATVVVMALQNQTLVSYAVMGSSSKLSLSTSTPIHRIAGSDVCLVLTGFIGDCNYLRKLADDYVLDYMRDYDSQPSMNRIARELAKVLNQSIKISDRPLIAHLVLLNSINGHIIEVQPSGMIYDTKATVIGQHLDYGQPLLEKEYHGNMTLSEARSLASSIILHSDHIERLDNDDDDDRVVSSVGEEIISRQ